MEELSADYCRICLKNQGCISIFDKLNDSPISEIFFMVFRITIENDQQIKEIPSMCCGDCLQSLMVAKELKKLCVESELKIKSFFRDDTTLNSSEPIETSRILPGLTVEQTPQMKRGESAIPPNQSYEEVFNDIFPESNESFQDFPQATEKNQANKPRKSKPEKEEPTTCRFCAKVFSNQSKARKHEDLSHLFTKDFLCDLCGQGFLFKSTVLHHLRKVHLQVKNYSCEYCGKTSFFKANHLSHLRTHDPNQVKMFICPTCQKGYSRKHNLKCHMRIHTGEKPYCCETCKKEFKYRSGYTRHLRNHTRRENLHRCSICSKGYLSRNAMLAHELKHSQPKKIRKSRVKKLNNEQTLEVNGDSFISTDPFFIPQLFGGQEL